MALFQGHPGSNPIDGNRFFVKLKREKSTRRLKEVSLLKTKVPKSNQNSL